MRKYKCFKCKTPTIEYEIHANHKYCKDCWEIKKKLIAEYEEFDALYQYVRGTVMGYDLKMALSSAMTLRLKGLTTAQILYKKDNKRADYSYTEVLIAFKLNSGAIHKAIASVAFKDEWHKFNYILKIVEPSINDVVLRLKKLNTIDDKTDTIDFNFSEANYTPKDKPNKLTEVLKDLW